MLEHPKVPIACYMSMSVSVSVSISMPISSHSPSVKLVWMWVCYSSAVVLLLLPLWLQCSLFQFISVQCSAVQLHWSTHSISITQNQFYWLKVHRIASHQTIQTRLTHIRSDYIAFYTFPFNLRCVALRCVALHCTALCCLFLENHPRLAFPSQHVHP